MESVISFADVMISHEAQLRRAEVDTVTRFERLSQWRLTKQALHERVEQPPTPPLDLVHSCLQRVTVAATST
jgi:hypothetical protein